MFNTNMRFIIMVGLLSLLILSGCVTLSVQPIFTDADIVREPLLAGLWGDPTGEDPESWQFKARKDATYELIVRDQDTLRVDPDRDGIFTAVLVRLDNKLYLDICPEEPPYGNEFYKGHVIPGHSFWRVVIEGNVLTIYSLGYEALVDGLESGRIVIDYYEGDGLFMLTARTGELQQMLITFQDELFTDPESMTRIR